MIFFIIKQTENDSRIRSDSVEVKANSAVQFRVFYIVVEIQSNRKLIFSQNLSFKKSW